MENNKVGSRAQPNHPTVKMKKNFESAQNLLHTPCLGMWNVIEMRAYSKIMHSSGDSNGIQLCPASSQLLRWGALV